MKLLLCVLLVAFAIPEGWAASKTENRSTKQVQAAKVKKAAAKKSAKKARNKAAKKKAKLAKAQRKQASKKSKPRVKLVEGKNTLKFSPPPASRSHAPKSEFPMMEGESLPPPETHEED